MRLQRALLALLCLSAFFLRVWRIDLVHFQIDESIASAVASQIGHLRRFPLTGIRTSFGFSNPPLYLYLLAPVFALFRDPRVAMTLVAALGSIAVIPVWQTARRLGGIPAAWAAAVILAFSPNAVEYSRRLWGHDMMVFLGAISVWGAVEAQARRRWKPLAISFVAAGAAQCIHLSGLLYWIPGLIVFAWPPRIDGRAKALGAGAGFLLLMVIPWVTNEFIEGFGETRLIAGQLAAGAAARDLGIPVPPAGAWVMILGDFWTNDLLGTVRPWWVSRTAAIFEAAATPCALALLGGGICYLCIAMVRTRCYRVEHAALAGLLLATPLLFGGLMKAVVPPYLLPALVPAVVGGGLFLGWVFRRKSKAAALTLLFVYTIASAGLTISVRSGIARGAGNGVPLAERMAVMEYLARDTSKRPFFLMQDARSLDTGLDVAYVYLGYWQDISARMLDRPSDSGDFYVLRERRTRIRPEPAVFLRHCPVRLETSHLMLYEIPAARREEWSSILRSHPAPHR